MSACAVRIHTVHKKTMSLKSIKNTYIVKVRDGYRITIPAAIMQELGITVGDTLDVTVQRGRIILTPIKNKLID